ncbi:hypothetical protein BB561_001860 [Smittium simulii]|uniref:Uncharacterized protein n=1 Tax=Smittium simulii TaxID=133385 RepID=A0A2T9YSN8_9FUNG|nr:hypothetical protein BB561_001860 [Smittium simulii]
MLPSMELQTAKFMGGIRVARAVILGGIKCSPISLNRFLVECCSILKRNDISTKSKVMIIEAVYKQLLDMMASFLECQQQDANSCKKLLIMHLEHYRSVKNQLQWVQITKKPPLLPASISMRLVGKLLGEELKLSRTRIRKDPTVLCVKTTLATAKFLNAITLQHYLMHNSIRLV